MSAILLKEDSFNRIKWWQILLIVWGVLQGGITIATMRMGHRQFLSLFAEPKRKRGHFMWIISWPIGFILTLFWPFLLAWSIWDSINNYGDEEGEKRKEGDLEAQGGTREYGKKEGVENMEGYEKVEQRKENETEKNQGGNAQVAGA
ncbi:hypothetical protein QBC40DRAFT_266667 [Triangularia verruculosa]|uniref:Uncharacterized protein n=1 Tax=Triangularia verruculosa TaxID=2587418 RepID=A0AAN6XFE8_9PEZI|nr:hypothetical protein QBC40DRAFT_266667 [Triangularia verruculosa]